MVWILKCIFLVIQKDTKPPLPTSVNAFMSNQLAWFLKGFSTVLAAMAEPGAVDVALVGSVRQGGPATIIIHSFNIVLFPALKQTHCTHWHVILNEWLYPFIAHIINIHGSGVLVALFGCCMAGAMWNAAISVQVLWTPFNHAPGYSVTSFKTT